MSRFLGPVWWGFKERFATCHLEHQSHLLWQQPGAACHPNKVGKFGDDKNTLNLQELTMLARFLQRCVATPGRGGVEIFRCATGASSYQLRWAGG